MLDALLFSKTPSLLTSVYKECLWKVNTKGKNLYLTFDDGPTAEITPFVLDELKKYNAKAAFFCIGKNVEANPELFRRIIAAGHSVGNHTYNHLNGWNYANAEYYYNIEKCAAVFTSEFPARPAGGRIPCPSGRRAHSELFRPPYGKMKPLQYKHLKQKYRIVMWDVLSFDFDAKMSQEKVLKNVTENAEPGSIVVFHDSLKAKARVEYALPKALEHFTAKGFKFEKL